MKKLLFIGNVRYRFNSFALSSSVAAHKLEIEFHIAGNRKIEGVSADAEIVCVCN